MKRLRTLKFFQKFKIKIKKSKNYSGCGPFPGLSSWCHSQADPIWPDDTFKGCLYQDKRGVGKVANVCPLDRGDRGFCLLILLSSLILIFFRFRQVKHNF